MPATLAAIVALFALSAGTVPAKGDYRSIGEINGMLGLIDASRVERTPTGGRVVMLGVLSRPSDVNGKPAVYLVMVKEFDCAGRRFRDMEATLFSRDFTTLESVGEIPGWTGAPDGSPFGDAMDHLCKGAPLPSAGVDFPTIGETFLIRSMPARP